MATGRSEYHVREVPYYLECPICLETFKKPKLLPCQHTICEDCLSTFIESTPVKNIRTLVSFQCPVCRGTVVPMNPSAPVDQWASHMPTNELISTSVSERILSKENCQACDAVGKSAVGSFWCKQCAGTLCNSCRNYHRGFGLSASHELIPLAQMQNEKIFDSTLYSGSLKCVQHKNKSLEVFCMEHQTMCCVICLLTHHRKCVDVRPLEDIAEIMEKTGQFRKLERYFEHLQKVFGSLLTQNRNNLACIRREQDGLIQRLDSLINEIKKNLDLFYNRLSNNLEEMFRSNTTSVQDAVTHIERFTDVLESGRRTLKQVLSQESIAQKIISFERVKSHVLAYFDDQLRKSGQLEKKAEISVNADRYLSVLEKILSETTVLESMLSRKMDIRIKESIVNPLFTELDISLLYPGFVIQYWTQTPKLKYNKTLKMDDDCSEPWSYGGSYTSKGLLLITDAANDKIKLYTESGKFLDYYDVLYPVDACEGNQPDEFYVSSSSPDAEIKGKILRMSFRRTLQVEQTIECKPGLWGITRHGSDLAVIYPSFVEKFNTKTGNHSPWVTKPKCDQVQCIAVSTKTGNVYFTDGNALLCYNVKGETVFQYTSETLQDTSGVALDAYDNVYVCDSKSGTVHQVSADGTRNRILLSDILEPHGIGFHPDGKQFFITSSAASQPFSVYSV